eukprot:2642568-Prymnesium_polylepis.1
MLPPSRARGAWVCGATWLPGRSFAAAQSIEGGGELSEMWSNGEDVTHAPLSMFERARATGR